MAKSVPCIHVCTLPLYSYSLLFPIILLSMMIFLNYFLFCIETIPFVSSVLLKLFIIEIWIPFILCSVSLLIYNLMNWYPLLFYCIICIDFVPLNSFTNLRCLLKFFIIIIIIITTLRTVSYTHLDVYKRQV